MWEFVRCICERLLCSRRGRRLGRVIVKTRTLKKPDDANTTSENIVADQEVDFPVKLSHRVMAIGRT